MAYIPFLNNAYFSAKVGIGTDSPASKLDVQGGMSQFSTTLTNNEDWANSPISINERGQVGSAQSADKYAPNLNFHWAGRSSKSLWLSFNGQLNFGEYSTAGVPVSPADGRINAATFAGDLNGTINTATTGTTQTAGNNSTKIATTAYADAAAGAVPIGDYLPLAGGTMTGNTVHNNNVKSIYGTASDGLEIYHDGSNSFIQDTGTGDLYVDAAANFFVRNQANGEVWIKGTDSGVSLRYQDSQKLITTSAGISVTGQLTVTNGIEMTAGNFNAGDNERIRLGNSADLQIYHDGSNSYIDDTSGTGSLYVNTNAFRLVSANKGENMIRAFEDGQVILSYNNFDKLATTSTGVSVTGAVSATTFLGDLNGTINTVTTAFTKPNATNDTTVATTAFVQNLIGTIPAGLVFQGTWNAATNTPTLTSGSGTTGHFYIVSTSGSTNLDGVTDWVTGDWAVFIEQGGTDAWEKIDNSSVLDGIGTGNRVAKWSGSGTSNTLTNSGIQDSSNAVAITINGNEEVGIGTTSPAKKLHVLNSTNEAQIRLGQSGSGSYDIGVYSGDKFSIGRDTDTQEFTLSNGNVGIGTTTPSSKLNISSVSYNDHITLTRSSDELGITVSGGQLMFEGGVSPFNNNDRDLGRSDKHWREAFVYSLRSGGALQFKTNGNNARMSIDTSGNVGIGTTSPTYKLQVAGKSYLSGGVQLNSGDKIDFGNSQQYITGVNSTSLTLATGNSATLTALDNGNVGIGTTAPGYKLEVNSGTTNNIAKFVSSDEGGLIAVKDSSGEVAFSNVGNDIYFKTSSSQSNKMVILNSGNVGIGTTSPSEKLDVVGSIKTTDKVKFYSSTSHYGSIYADSEGLNLDTVANRHMIFKKANVEVMRISTSGNVGIGTTNPADKLDLYDVNDNVGMYFHTATSGTGGGNGLRVGQNNANAFIWNYENTPLSLATNGTARLTVKGDGKIRLNSYGAGSNTGTATQKLGVDSSGNIIEIPFGGGAIDGSGTTNYVTKWIDGDTVGDSVIFDNGTNVGIGTTSPGAKLDVDGGIKMADDTDTASLSKVGTLKYRVSGNNSYVDMCMQTGATTYAWINIVQNNW
jgi:hypothetical protein